MDKKKTGAELRKEIEESPLLQEDALKERWKSGQLSISADQMKHLLDAVDKNYERWFNENLSALSEETGEQIDITWDEAKKYITLRDLKEITPFKDFIQVVKEVRRQEEEREKEQNAVQHQIVPQIQVQDITRAVMLMNYSIDDIGDEYTQKSFIDPDNKKLGKVKLTLVNATGAPLRLVPYERSVASALWSYYLKAGIEKGFSYQDITRFILQREHVSKESVSEVKEVIQNFRHIDVLIDYREHAKAKNLKHPEECIIKRYLAPVDEVMIKHSNGYIDEGIKFIATPPLFQYADDVGEIMSTDTRYLDIPINMHLKTDVPVRDYLKRRVNQLSRGKEKQAKILLSSITEKCGQKPYSDMTRTEKNRLRKRIEVIFTTWEKEDKKSGLHRLLISHKPVKDGQEITGYIISAPEEEE